MPDWSNCEKVPSCENVSRHEFETIIQSAHRPAILKGALSHWPCVKAAQQSPLELCRFIKGRANQKTANCFFAPPQINGRFFYGSDLESFNFDVRSASIPVLIDLLLRLQNEPNPPAMYAGALPLDLHFDGFLADHPLDLVPQGVETRASIWIGNQTITAAHWDLPDNIAGVIGGRRRFILFPNSQKPNLYFGPSDHTLAGQPISLVDFHNPDYAQFPKFRQALEHAQVADLEPGDAIYIPSLWIHHVQSRDRVGMLINFWWRQSQAEI